MSAYVNCETEYKDQETLVESLKAMGYTVESHKEAQHLFGYHGDQRPQKAHVIIRRKYVGSSANDVGFERLANGTFVAHISEYDGRSTFTAAKQTELKRTYAGSQVKKLAKQKGYKIVSETSKDGKIRMVLRKYN